MNHNADPGADQADPPPAHPARTMAYPDLVSGLDRACAQGFVYRRPHPTLGLDLYVYSPRCVYERGWDEFSTMARGLIIDPIAQRVVATPFPKFFNVGEPGVEVPDLPFQAYEKLDGSLIIAFHHAGRWMCSTKGSFASDQAIWAQSRMDRADLGALVVGSTYLFEAVYPENRIVVRYPQPALVMLAAYDSRGVELDYEAIQATCAALGWRAAGRQEFTCLAQMAEHAAQLDGDSEGYVVRFSNGLRLKLKGAEYCRLHARIARCTPLAIWEAMYAGQDLEALRRDLPEEFWPDFDSITGLLAQGVARVEARVASVAHDIADIDDRRLGLTLDQQPGDVRPYLFGYRKNGCIQGSGMLRLLRTLRPTANVLAGYVPSYSMGRVLEDLG